MKVTIDGTTYVPVTADRITVNGVEYAKLGDLSPGTFEDKDGDRWQKAKPGPFTGNDMYECMSGTLKGNRCQYTYIDENWGPLKNL